MPVRARKTVATKRRKRRTAATKSATARKKTTTKRRKKRATAARSTTTRRRRRAKVGAKKTATKRPRRKTRAATRKRVKAATRRSPKKKAASRVKKKPNKSKISKKTSAPSRLRGNRKPRALIISTVTQDQEKTDVIWAPAEKKQKQVKSDSQALPTVKQQPAIETKMAKSNKPKKRAEKKRLSAEIRLESIPTHSEIDLNIAPYKERPGEDYMSLSQKEHFRSLLKQRKEILLKEMGRTVHHLQDEGTPLPDISDRATQEEEFNLELRARDRERKLINKIEDTIKQIDEGRYGYCSSCGVEIGIRRLEARPTATLCIECKTCDEIREKQMGG